MPGYLNPTSFSEGPLCAETLSRFSLSLCQALRQVGHVKALSCITWDSACTHCCSAGMSSEFPPKRWLHWIPLLLQNKSNTDCTKPPFWFTWDLLLGESRAGCVVQVETEIQLMIWWKLEWSHPSFGLDSYPSGAGCTVWSQHFLAHSSVTMNPHVRGGPHHTSWADLISIALQT